MNVVGPSKRLEESVISKAFVAAGGSELVDVCIFEPGHVISNNVAFGQV